MSGDDWGLDETRASEDEPATLRFSEGERERLAARVWSAYRPPPRIGPYRLGERLGRGGMARVHLGVDPRGRRVAIKLLAPEPGREDDDPEGVARFAREAEALAKLSTHPGIVTIESAGQTDSGLPYLIMELVEGPSLREALREGLPREAALDHLETVAEALAHAHQHGILHRDIKPANVLLAPDGARLADFGLARLLRSDQRLTQTGDVLGTPAYMAPEQASPELGAVGTWTDVWALGVVLHEILAGQPPYQGSSYEIFSQLVTRQPIAETRSGPHGTRSPLDALCTRTLQAAATHRPADAAAFLRELRAARSAPLAPRRARLSWGLTALLLVGSGVGLAALARSRPSAPRTAASPPETTPPPTPVAPLSWAGQARTAAWRGDQAAAERALERLPSDRATALRWELRTHLHGQPPEPGAPAGWGAWSRGSQALSQGSPARAELAWVGLVRAADPALRLESLLGLAALALTRGETARVDARLTAALGAAAHPLDRGRVAALGAACAAAWAEPLPALERILGEPPLETARRLAPEAPWTALATEGDRSRPAAVAAERERAAQGDDGLVGLLLTRACRLAERAELGASRYGAREALRLSEAAARLRPRTLAARAATARALRVLHRSDSRTALDEASALAPDDPALRLEQARAGLADAAARLATWTPAAAQPESRRLLQAFERAARAFEGLPAPEARLGALSAWAWCYRLARGLGWPADDAQRELVSLRAELLGDAPLDALLAARQALSLALREDPAGVPEAERRLVDVARRLDATQRAALRLGAVGPDARRWWRAHLALSGDAPSRVELAVRLAQLDLDGARSHAQALLGPGEAQPWIVDARLRDAGPSALREAPLFQALADALIERPWRCDGALREAGSLSAAERQALDDVLRTRADEPERRDLARLLLWTSAAPTTPATARRACDLGEELVRRRPSWVAPRLLLAAALQAGAQPGDGEPTPGEALWQLRLAQAQAPQDGTALRWSLRLGLEATPELARVLTAQGDLSSSSADWIPSPARVRQALEAPDYQPLLELLSALDAAPEGWALACTLRMAAADGWEGTFDVAPPRAQDDDALAAFARVGQAWAARAELLLIDEPQSTAEAAAELFRARTQACLACVPAGRLDRWNTPLPPPEAQPDAAGLPRLQRAWRRLQTGTPLWSLSLPLLWDALGQEPPPTLSADDLDDPFGVASALAAGPYDAWTLDELAPGLVQGEAWDELPLLHDRWVAAHPELELAEAVWRRVRSARSLAYGAPRVVDQLRGLEQALGFLDHWRARGVDGPALASRALDVALDLAGFTPPGGARRRWLERAARELERAAGQPAPFVELASETAWREVRAHVALGQTSRALQALERVERALSREGLPGPHEGVRWAVEGDPWRDALDAVPAVRDLLQRLGA